ncbi:tetratricopeptide repeat protein [Rhodospirillaceae bacterium SYSU D60014]|uniref:tetratricopeptide repeat protein n=1 Tax=Virgifigura deserti TaxID=2268457 RepID=UPI000E662839
MTEALATEAALTPPLPPCLVMDVLWEAFTEEGAAAFEESRSSDALSFWRVAEQMAVAFADSDPRRGASLANLAAAMDVSFTDDPQPIEARYRHALACWDQTHDWIERMIPDHKPHSSLYHHRLERKYAGAYAEIARRGYRRLAEGGRAACLGNLAGLLNRLGRTDEAESLYRDAVAVREPALGARDVGTMYLFETLAALLAASGRADDAEAARAKAEAIAANHPLTPRRRWRSEKPVRMSDDRRLLAAVYLTPVIRRR